MSYGLNIEMHKQVSFINVKLRKQFIGFYHAGFVFSHCMLGVGVCGLFFCPSSSVCQHSAARIASSWLQD